MEHEFTKEIKKILKDMYGGPYNDIFNNSIIIQYINIKTKSAGKSSKSRGSYASLYAIYVLVEDYIKKDFQNTGRYNDYEGAVFTELFRRQRELPFGKKLQNHALNHRMNEEFRKYFPDVSYIPILRDVTTSRYWFNENLLKVKINSEEYNISKAIISIIDAYIEAKKSSFDSFLELCEKAKNFDDIKVTKLIADQVKPTVDARIFEIVSYSILKYYYNNIDIYWGFELSNICKDKLTLFKTGRTNANDGGIDFVMKPLGRFFQVTETIDVNKYFLDIDKIEKYPITFVIKSSDSVELLRRKILDQARKQFSINPVISKYMSCIEEIINVPILLNRFEEAVNQGYLKNILDEIIRQSKVEFNYEDENEENDT